jgi:hypothetical protein
MAMSSPSWKIAMESRRSPPFCRISTPTWKRNQDYFWERAQRLPVALLITQISIMITEILTNAGLVLDPSEDSGRKMTPFGFFDVADQLIFITVCGMFLIGEVMSMRLYLV